MTLRFRGLFEPHEVPTGDRRMFKAMGLTNRDLPMPLMARTSSGGHTGAEVIGEITKIENGPKGRWYSGTFLDPKIVPAVTKAIYLAKKKLIGPSVDLDRSFTVEPRPHTDGKPIAYFTSGNVIGTTLVPMPAFSDVTFEVEGDVEDIQSLTATLWVMENFAVSGAAWDSLPIAPRNYKFDADDAVKRIAQWSGVGTPQADTNKYASMFLWRGGNQTGDSLAQEDFRLPIGDVINGQPYLIYHAIYAAAALLSGGHGGLPNIPDGEKTAIKGVINQIYPRMADAFGDEQMKSPFVAGESAPQQAQQQPVQQQPQQQMASGEIIEFDSDGLTEFAVKGTSRPSITVFHNPQLTAPTPLTVTDDGRVFGHLGKWGECHIGIGDRCVLLPKTRTGYQLFKSGTVRTAEGQDVQVGKITLGTGHAHPQYGIVPARDHYDNSGWCAAVVNIGEDKHGVWVAGALVDRSKADELRRSPLSGDWRRYNGSLELVAALAVNNPGFPVFTIAENEELSLLAAGMVLHDDVEAPTGILAIPASADIEFDIEGFEAEIAARILRRRARLEAIQQNERRRRLRQMVGFATNGAPPAQPTAGPVGQAANPAGGGAKTGSESQSKASSQTAPMVDKNGDGVADPDADPNTPGIAQVDDPGRETMLARQRDAVYTVVPESDAEPTETETTTEVVPEGQQAQPQPQAQPVQQAPQPAPMPAQ